MTNSTTTPATPAADHAQSNQPWTHKEYGVKWTEDRGGTPWFAGPHTKDECLKAIDAAGTVGKYHGELAVRTVTTSAWGTAGASA